MLPVVPLLCVLIVALYLGMRLGRAPDPRAVAARLALLAAAAWIGEDTMVRAYAFYGYAGHLGPLLDRVPVLVPLIWAVVIDSAWFLASCLTTRRLPLVAGAIVLCDAALIEPVAVRAGLWSWAEPGIFEVPLIGVLGWALFTAAAVWVHGQLAGWARPVVRALVTVLVPALATHAAILVAWWVAFRWVGGALDPWAGVAVVWVLLPALAVLSWRRGLRRLIPRAAMLVRVPGAVFFYALLAEHGRNDAALVAWALAFVWPYLALVDPAQGRASAPAHERGPAPP